MPKKVLIALPPAMLEQVDYVAELECRTRSDLIREALRRYLDNFKRQSGGLPVRLITMETPETADEPEVEAPTPKQPTPQIVPEPMPKAAAVFKPPEVVSESINQAGFKVQKLEGAYAGG